jgi:hypothetical protein
MYGPTELSRSRQKTAVAATHVEQLAASAAMRFEQLDQACDLVRVRAAAIGSPIGSIIGVVMELDPAGAAARAPQERPVARMAVGHRRPAARDATGDTDVDHARTLAASASVPNR